MLQEDYPIKKYANTDSLLGQEKINMTRIFKLNYSGGIFILVYKTHFFSEYLVILDIS